MGAATNVITFSDIYTEILNKMRQPTGITAITNQAKRYANQGLYEMVFGFEYKLPWLERDAVLTTHAPYSTGTVAIARGSTTLSGTSTLWDSLNAYGVANARTTGKISLGGTDIYKISTVAASSITLQQRYVASADLAAGADYIYFEDEYALASDFLKPIDYSRFTAAMKLTLIGRNEFRQQFPRPNICGIPTVATLLDKSFSGSTTPQMMVQFYPYPNNEYMLPYSYITSNLAVTAAGVEQSNMVNDTDEPSLPIRYRDALVSFSIAKWYRDKKDDARALSAQQDYQDQVNRIVGDQRIGANTMAQMQPKVGMYNARSPYGGIAGKRRYSTNNSFDDFRS